MSDTVINIGISILHKIEHKMIEDIMININRGSHKAANDPFIHINGVKLSAVILLQTFTCYKKNCALFKNLNNTSIYKKTLKYQ